MCWICQDDTEYTHVPLQHPLGRDVSKLNPLTATYAGTSILEKAYKQRHPCIKFIYARSRSRYKNVQIPQLQKFPNPNSVMRGVMA